MLVKWATCVRAAGYPCGRREAIDSSVVERRGFSFLVVARTKKSKELYNFLCRIFSASTYSRSKT